MGQPKAWLPFGDERLLPRTVRILREVVSPVVVVAAPGQALPELPPEIRIARDEVEGKGPLGGLAAGLAALHGAVDAAYLSSCDVPFLSPAFVSRVTELLGIHEICVPRIGHYHHPLSAVYRLSVLPHVRRLLAEGRLRPVFLFDAVATRVLSEADLAAVDGGQDSLRNVNTPEEYEAALQELAKTRPA